MIALTAFCAFAVNTALADPTSSTGPTVEVVKPPTTCGGYVTGHAYNNLLRKQKALTGHRPKARNGRVTKCAYIKRKRVVKKAKHDCRRSRKTVTASTFGTSSGDDNGVGYRGDDLFSYNDSFAELSNPGTLDFCALGCLSLHAVRWVHYGGRTERGVKRDVGKGGPGLRGTIRGIDLHAPFARRLHFGGLGVVTITRRPCKGVF